MTVCLEHRFFGTSFPEDFVGDSPHDFESLTLDNVVQDAVSFVKHIKKSIPGSESSKVIVTGGSYAGWLSTQFRIQEPDVFYGAIAMSPALYGFGPFPNNTYKYSFMNQVSNIYYDYSLEAGNKIKNAMHNFDSCAKSGNCSSIEGFNLCGRQPNSTELILLYEQLVSHYKLMTMFNYPVAVNYPAYPVETVVNRTLAAQNEFAVLRVTLDIVTNTTNTSICVEWESPDISGGEEGLVTTAWFTILCSYVWAPQAAIPPVESGNIFAPKFVNTRQNCPLPQGWWKFPYNTSEEYRRELAGLTKNNLENTERLLIVNGEQDPTSSMSIMGLGFGETGAMRSRELNVGMMAHGEAHLPEWILPKGVKPTIDDARNVQLQTVKGWLE